MRHGWAASCRHPIKGKSEVCLNNEWGMIWAKVTAFFPSLSRLSFKLSAETRFISPGMTDSKSCFWTNEVWLQRARIMDVSLRVSGLRFHENRLPCCFCVCVMSLAEETQREDILRVRPRWEEQRSLNVITWPLQDFTELLQTYASVRGALFGKNYRANWNTAMMMYERWEVICGMRPNCNSMLVLIALCCWILLSAAHTYIFLVPLPTTNAVAVVFKHIKSSLGICLYSSSCLFSEYI